MRNQIIIASPVRTAIGAFNGSLKQISAVELGAKAIEGVVRQSGLKKDLVDAVVMGNVVQAGNKMNPARQAALYGGLNVSTPAMTINRVCGSGAQAIVTAVQDIAFGTSRLAIAGGMENMDRAPYLIEQGRWGYRAGDGQIIDSMLHDGLHDAFSNEHSGWHTEDLIEKYCLKREEQDRWAERSQRRFSEAQGKGLFNNEIIHIDVPVKKGIVIFDKDETNRPDTTLDTLARLKPVFRSNGTITAGNAPGLNSGASAMIVAQREFAEENNILPLARVVSYAINAVEPDMFGIAPAFSIKAAVERAGWTLDDIERIEINEAYAAVPLAIIKKLKITEEIVNVEGGAIAHGHPIGATGAILTTRLIHSMRRDGLKRGLVTLCIGGGQAIALAIEVIG
jgi:acetyl-CoA C-acetyltransferase